MGIDTSKYKVVFKDKVFNCLEIRPYINETDDKPRIEMVEVIYLNTDNRLEIIRGESDKFQFLSK